MYPKTGYYLMNRYHIADLRHQAQRSALARAARQARKSRIHQSSHPGPLPALGRHTRTVLGARSHSIAPR